MDTNIIGDVIKRYDRRLLLVAFGLVILFIAIGAISFNAYRNALQGPIEADPKAIRGLETLDGLADYHISITGENAYDSGVELVTTEDGRETDRRGYALLDLGRNRLLLVETSSFSRPRETYEGVLVPFPSEVQREIVDSLYSDDPSLREDMLPFMLDNREMGDVIAGMFFNGLGLLGAVGLVGYTLWRMQDSKRHPIMKALKRFGEPETVVREIEGEMAMSSQPVTKHVKVTRHWLMYHQGGILRIVKLDDLVWMYQKVTQRRVNGVPAGKTYEAILYDKHGKLTTVQGKQQDIEATLSAVYQRAPWVITGYSAELDKAWRKDRASMISAVDARRTQVAR